jgi:ribosomal protein S6--L-glutamate ligase
VAVLVERRYLTQSQPAGLRAELVARGHEVGTVVTDPMAGPRRVPDWSAYDVVVARGRGRQLLALLTSAEAAGLPVVNSATAVRSVVDKAVMGRRLAAGGVPVPRTRCVEAHELLRGSWRFPLICKPVRGDNARGIQVVHSADELRALRWTEKVALVQEFLPGDGRDLKVYGAGDRVWAVRRVSPLDQDRADTPESVPVGPELAELAHRCRDLFGLTAYGVDCVLTAAGPVVLEVNDFPNYTGVADASAALADHVTSLVPSARKAVPCASR